MGPLKLRRSAKLGDGRLNAVGSLRSAATSVPEKGLARGLGCAARVHSPTFTIVNDYLDCRLPLYHLDVYRLETPAQIAGAGLEEFLRPDGVTVIEWAERLVEVFKLVWVPAAA